MSRRVTVPYGAGAATRAVFGDGIVESPYRQRVIQMFARHRVPLQMDIEMPTLKSIKMLVEMKKGVAIVPRMCVESEVARGGLRASGSARCAWSGGSISYTVATGRLPQPPRNSSKSSGRSARPASAPTERDANS